MNKKNKLENNIHLFNDNKIIDLEKIFILIKERELYFSYYIGIQYIYLVSISKFINCAYVKISGGGVGVEVCYIGP